MLGPAAMFVAFSLIAFSRSDTTVLASTAFTSLTILSLVGPPLATLIQTIPNLLSAMICFGRIQESLEAEPAPGSGSYRSDAVVTSESSGRRFRSDITEGIELESLNESITPDNSGVLAAAAQVDISWSRTAKAVLKNVSFTIASTDLLIVTGPTGCGKSTLINALLGEACVLAGTLTSERSRMAVCDQTAWLREGSIRDNIVSTSEYDPRWYKSVIEACELTSDLELFAEGDAFAVGSKGQALSGGQRQRVVLYYARPVPQRHDY